MNDLKGIIEDCNKSDLISDKIIKKIIEIIGQEEWQDLHDENNDICTTMGELIITLKGIADLEKENAELKELLEACKQERIEALYRNEQYIKENAELKKVAEFQQSSNMSRHFENKKLKEGLAVGSIFNKALNSMNKNLEEERDKYRNMVFDLQKENAELKKQVGQKQHLADVRLEQSLENYKLFSDERKERIDIDIALEDMTDNLTKAREFLNEFMRISKASDEDFEHDYSELIADTEQFISDVEK